MFGHRAACDLGTDRRPNAIRKTRNYYAIILFFILGGAIGALTTANWRKALLLTCIPLSLVFAVMFVEEEHTLEAEETAGKRTVKPSIKLIAADMDGTLLSSRKQPPKGFFPLVRTLKIGVRSASDGSITTCTSSSVR